MLYISLVLSAVLLFFVNWMIAHSRYAVPKSLALTFVVALGPTTCLLVALPAVSLQALLLSLLLFVLLIPRRGKHLYLALSCVASVAAYTVVIVPAFEKHRENVQLREQYPLESLEDRLPKRTGWAAPVESTKRLEELEGAFEREVFTGKFSNTRSDALQRLHTQQLTEFVDSAGFGVGRMIRKPTISAALNQGEPRDENPIPQADYLNPSVPSAEKLTAKVPFWNAGRMQSLHQDNVIDFLNPRGFGYFKSRREVAGFQSHGMSKVPEGVKPWEFAHVELIGLLLHDSPVAYPSANLPKMNELKKAPTRPLDAFEVEALESLKAGEDLFVRGTEDKARMVGSIRATKQCLDCHSGNRGDLLGAFSYGFRREVK